MGLKSEAAFLKFIYESKIKFLCGKKFNLKKNATHFVAKFLI